MPRIYEGMFLLDNQLVREDWQKAKSSVTGLIEKHGGKVLTARRWDERRLAYPIKKRKRATYLLAFAEVPGGGLDTLRRDLEITENVLRYLILAVDEVPSGEIELHEAELVAGFTVPAPPDDDMVEEGADEFVELDLDDDGLDRGRRRRRVAEPVVDADETVAVEDEVETVETGD